MALIKKPDDLGGQRLLIISQHVVQEKAFIFHDMYGLMAGWAKRQGKGSWAVEGAPERRSQVPGPPTTPRTGRACTPARLHSPHQMRTLSGPTII